jgi:hypothetical protein
MRFISRGALAASVAALALSVAGVATASAALPEFVPDGGAKFPIAASGSVTGEAESSIRMDVPVISWFYCKNAKFSDEITGAKAVSVTTDLEGCHEKTATSHECASAGAASGTIVLSGKGSLVYLEKATKKVGVLLPVGKVKVTCKDNETEKYTITGSILSPITPVNTELTTYELRYREKKAGLEEYTAYENESGKKTSTEFSLETPEWIEELGLEIAPKIQLTANKAFTISA